MDHRIISNLSKLFAFMWGGVRNHMKERKIDILAQQLRNNIDILDGTFEKCDLEVLSVGISDVNNYGWFSIIVEILKKNSEKLEDNIKIKVNAYDEDGIIYSESAYINAEKFLGYDTAIIYCHENNLIYRTNKIRIFLTKQ